MTSVSHVAASHAVAAAVSTPAPAPAAPKPKAVAAPSAGAAATVELSQKALAKLQGDKDWLPGMKVDNF